MPFEIKLMNNVDIFMAVSYLTTIDNLKKTISEGEDCFLPEQIVLNFNGIVVSNNDSLKQAYINCGCPLNFRLVQKRAQLWQIKELEVDREREDLITCEPGVARMSCGHWFGSSLEGLV